MFGGERVLVFEVRVGGVWCVFVVFLLLSAISEQAGGHFRRGENRVKSQDTGETVKKESGNFH